MAKIATRISVPIILAGAFVSVIFISLFSYESININLLIIICFLFLFVFFFGFASGQNVSSPVKKILERANDLNRGDLKTRVYLETKDELSELARTFNQIAEKLEESKNAEESTEKSVDIKVRAKTQVLEETINALEQKIKNRTIELQRVTEELKGIKEGLERETPIRKTGGKEEK